MHFFCIFYLFFLDHTCSFISHLLPRDFSKLFHIFLDIRFITFRLLCMCVCLIPSRSRSPDIYETLTHSIAPNIFGLDDIKRGILCQLFGGANKDFSGARTRKLFESISSPQIIYQACSS